MELAKSSSPIRNDRLDVKLKTMLDMLETVELGSGTKTKLVDDEKRPQKIEQNQVFERTAEIPQTNWREQYTAQKRMNLILINVKAIYSSETNSKEIVEVCSCFYHLMQVEPEILKTSKCEEEYLTRMIKWTREYVYKPLSHIN
ncbi:unnamed protein product [Hymenolepis diminuta]|uniref:Uncharacterized protein n=1 Tax=Hymenolepis diminuta TaxID=6216 RepID=A0A564ZBU9_HYMDI|nr:unnamed protein product [Hymenolepis diminuta]